MKFRPKQFFWSAGIAAFIGVVTVVGIYDPGTPAERFDHGRKVGALVQLTPCSMSGCGIITIELRGAAGILKAKWIQD